MGLDRSHHRIGVNQERKRNKMIDEYNRSAKIQLK